MSDPGPDGGGPAAPTVMSLLEDASLRELVTRVIVYFHNEPDMALLGAEGVNVDRLEQQKKKTASKSKKPKVSGRHCNV